MDPNLLLSCSKYKVRPASLAILMVVKTEGRTVWKIMFGFQILPFATILSRFRIHIGYDDLNCLRKLLSVLTLHLWGCYSIVPVIGSLSVLEHAQ